MAHSQTAATPAAHQQAPPNPGTRSTRATASASSISATVKQNKPAEQVLNPAIGKLPRPQFPPDSLRDQLSPDDLADSMLMSICSVFMAVDNRALCPKEIAEVMQYWGWTTPGSQPFAVISTCIRTHLKRRGLGLNNHYVKQGPPPLVSSWDLTTTIPPEDQAVMGIEPHAKPAVKRGTLWYLSKAAGYSSPFGDRHPDSLFMPCIPRKGSALSKQASAPRAKTSAPGLAVSMPPSSSASWTSDAPQTVPLLDSQPSLADMGRGKRKRKISSMASSESPTQVPLSASTPSQLSSRMTATAETPATSSVDQQNGISFVLPSASGHRRTASSDPAAANPSIRRLKVKLNAPLQCPVFSEPIDTEEEEEDDAGKPEDVDMHDDVDAGINAETLASERRRFRKRSRSEGNILLATPIAMSSPPSTTSSTATLTSGYAPDYFAPAYAHSSAALPISVSAPTGDNWPSLHAMEADASDLSKSVPETRALDLSSTESTSSAEMSSPAHTVHRRVSMPDYFAPRHNIAAIATGLGVCHSEERAKTDEVSSELADGEESANEGAYDFAFDEPEDTVSTAATTPRSPVQVKEEPLDVDFTFILNPPRDQHSPMPDLPSLPILAQAQEEDRSVDQHSETDDCEAHFSPGKPQSPGRYDKFNALRQRSVSPNDSIYTFGHIDSPSASASRGASPCNVSISEAPSPYSDDDDLLAPDGDASDEEYIARQSLSPVVDLKELDLGFSRSQRLSAGDGHDPTKPFGPEVFGLLCHEPITPWQPSSSTSELLASCDAFDMTFVPASDDFLHFQDVPDPSSEPPIELTQTQTSSPEPSSSPERPPPRASRKRSSTAATVQPPPPPKVKAKVTSSPRSTRSSARTNVKAAPPAVVDEPRHTRSASNSQAALAAQEATRTARSTRSKRR